MKSFVQLTVLGSFLLTLSTARTIDLRSVNANLDIDNMQTDDLEKRDEPLELVDDQANGASTTGGLTTGQLLWMRTFPKYTHTACSKVKMGKSPPAGHLVTVAGSQYPNSCGEPVQIQLAPRRGSNSKRAPAEMTTGIVWDICDNCDPGTIITTTDIWQELGVPLNRGMVPALYIVGAARDPAPVPPPRRGKPSKQRTNQVPPSGRLDPKKQQINQEGQPGQESTNPDQQRPEANPRLRGQNSGNPNWPPPSGRLDPKKQQINQEGQPGQEPTNSDQQPPEANPRSRGQKPVNSNKQQNKQNVVQPSQTGQETTNADQVQPEAKPKPGAPNQRLSPNTETSQQ